MLERVKGIEPSSQAWEARILPLNHTRLHSALRNSGAARPPDLKSFLPDSLPTGN